MLARGHDRAGVQAIAARHRRSDRQAAPGERRSDLGLGLELIDAAAVAVELEPAYAALGLDPREPARHPLDPGAAANRRDRVHGSAFSAPGARTVDLSRRRPLARRLSALAVLHADHPGAALTIDALFERAWPGERALASARTNRVNVALVALRKLGLRGLLQRTSSGYLLDPGAAVELSADGAQPGGEYRGGSTAHPRSWSSVDQLAAVPGRRDEGLPRLRSARRRRLARLAHDGQRRHRVFREQVGSVRPPRVAVEHQGGLHVAATGRRLGKHDRALAVRPKRELQQPPVAVHRRLAGRPPDDGRTGRGPAIDARHLESIGRPDPFDVRAHQLRGLRTPCAVDRLGVVLADRLLVLFVIEARWRDTGRWLPMIAGRRGALELPDPLLHPGQIIGGIPPGEQRGRRTGLRPGGHGTRGGVIATGRGVLPGLAADLAQADRDQGAGDDTGGDRRKQQDTRR
jgi:hypothetical protein